jgi:hypothetical protein
MPHKPDDVDMIFSIAADASMEQAMQALNLAKVKINRPLGEIHMILGTGQLSQLDNLRKLPVFQSVDVDFPVQIAPPGDPIQ